MAAPRPLEPRDRPWGPPPFVAWRERGGPPWPLLAIPLLVIQLIGTAAASRHQDEARALDALGWLLVVAGPVAVAALRRAPLPGLLGAVGAAALYLGLGYPRGPVVLSAGAALVITVVRGRRRVAWTVGWAGLAGAVGLAAGTGYAFGLTAGVGYAAWLTALLLLAELPRRRREQFAAARRARLAESEVAAGEERLALARDLHDTIGHSLSLISVQAGVALHLLDTQPEQARPALTAIRAASKEALDEVRTVLDVLRSDGDAVPRSPAPGLSRADGLIAAAEAGGLRVVCVPQPLSAAAVGLPASTSAAAYRFLQEALTNVARHARATTVHVEVRRDPAGLHLSVADDGGGAARLVEGRGMTGMRERASALGGRVEVAATEPGFRVAMHLPWPGPVPE